MLEVSADDRNAGLQDQLQSDVVEVTPPGPLQLESRRQLAPTRSPADSSEGTAVVRWGVVEGAIIRFWYHCALHDSELDVLYFQLVASASDPYRHKVLSASG